MQISPAVLDDVRRLVAEVLEFEFDEVGAQSRFFTDLDGQSIELLDLSFRIEKQLGVRVRFNDLTASDIELDAEGRLTPASLAVFVQTALAAKQTAGATVADATEKR